ncbi:pre-rRNA-processing protein esf2 [Aplysia californica]|uniref:Activator of basal transcription 1 n=1 Tax=Aplysia californica TaxID=6500 RepID=A0ABM0JXE8_APLCA|nr:pre-rRNA-processing protein esf2 [Aplysia californica]
MDGQQISMDEASSSDQEQSPQLQFARPSKKRSHSLESERPGIIYLSAVPEFMTVQRLRNTFEEFGEINRTFFQPVEKSYSYKKGLLFSEGWVEFRQRKVAKYVAVALNNTQVGGKKRNPWYNCIWNIKYLPKFTWTDVNADRELKRATYDSRIRADISQVKKQTNYYVSNIEKSKTLQEMKKRKEKKGEVFEKRTFGDGAQQKLTDEEILANKKGKKRKSSDESSEKKAKLQRKTFTGANEDASRSFVMKNIFGSSS